MSISDKTVLVSNTPGGNLTSTSNSADHGIGVYVKTGIRGDHAGFFNGGGTRSKITVGLSWTN
jgi:hypothetical protein